MCNDRDPVIVTQITIFTVIEWRMTRRGKKTRRRSNKKREKKKTKMKRQRSHASQPDKFGVGESTSSGREDVPSKDDITVCTDLIL